MISQEALDALLAHHAQLNQGVQQPDDPSEKPPLVSTLAPTGVSLSNRPDRIRGSVDLPLTEDGRKGVQALAKQIASKGGFDEIHTSDMQRTLETAKEISKATNAPVFVNPALRDVAYGDLEGQPTQNVINYINDRITNHPDEKFEGQTPLSTSAGESFNEYKQRLFPEVWKSMHSLEADPDQKIGYVLNRRSIKTLDGMLHKGSPYDSQTSDSHVTAYGDDTEPGSIHRMAPDDKGKWKIQDIDALKGIDELPGGIYFVRHGETEWNGGKDLANARKDLSSIGANISAGDSTVNVPAPVSGPPTKSTASKPGSLPKVPQDQPPRPQFIRDGQNVEGSHDGHIVLADGTFSSLTTPEGHPERYLPALQAHGYPELTTAQIAALQQKAKKTLPKRP